MAVGTGGAFVVDFSQVREMLDDLDDAKKALNALDPYSGQRISGYAHRGTQMERALRREVRKMTQKVIIPALIQAGHATGRELDAAMADTARAMNDRLPVVKVGAVNPKMEHDQYPSASGLKRSRNRARSRGTLAYGSEYGPLGAFGPAMPRTLGRGKTRRIAGGGRGGAQPGVNYYGKPRNDSGYWITPTINSARVTRGVIQGYSNVANEVFDKFTARWGAATALRAEFAGRTWRR